MTLLYDHRAHSELVKSGDIAQHRADIYVQDGAFASSLNSLVDNVTNGDYVNLVGFTTYGDGGGGQWRYDSTKARSEANLGTILDTSVALTVAAQGTGAGTGCWVRDYSGAVSLQWFNAMGGGVIDDSAAIAAAIAADGCIDISNGSFLYSSSTTHSVSNKVISGNGTILIDSGTGFSLTGDNNKVSSITIKAATKSVSASMNYTNWGLEINGDNNVVDSVEIYNIDGSGVVLRGTGNKVTKSNLHDNITGLRTDANSRDVLIHGNIIKDNNVNHESGADGILLHRSTMRVSVTDNELSNNGEHGLYGQGQDYYIAGNRVFDNGEVGVKGTGLKFGSYETNLSFITGETQDDYEWVVDSNNFNGGGVGETYYGMQNIVVIGNECWDNRGDRGIYFQPSARNVLVTNNIVRNNDIRLGYFNYTGGDERLEDFYDCAVENNLVTNGRITISGNNHMRAINNRITEGARGDTTGKLSTYAPNATTEPRLDADMYQCELIDNSVDYLVLSRVSAALVQGNRVAKQFCVSTNCDTTILRGNQFVLEDLTPDGTGVGPLDTARIIEMTNNVVSVVGDIAFNDSAVTFSFPETFIGNSIVGSTFDSTGDTFFISSTPSGNIPEHGRFNDNHVECVAAKYAIKLEGSWCAVDGNVIVALDHADTVAIENHGGRMAISNNIIRYGDILNKNHTDHTISGNRMSGDIRYESTGTGTTEDGYTVGMTLLTDLTASATWSGGIPAGAMVLGVTTVVETTVTGPTSFQIGYGADADAWGDTSGFAVDDTTDSTDFTLASPVYRPSATNIVLTPVGGAFTAGAVRVALKYVLCEPMTT